ncbi:MAG: 3-dehydroquinate synthase [Dehalococcoidia bacterium]
MAVDRIFLVGLSGSGKSTVGRLVADSLGWQFVDSDRLIEEREGRSIPEIIGPNLEHEAHFRSLESAALASLAGRDSVVIATGGGAPTTSDSRESLASGLVVWLDVSPESAAGRLQGDPATEARPLLLGSVLDRLKRLHRERLHLYEQSDHSVAVDYYRPEQVAGRIVDIVRGSQSQDWRPDRARFAERAARSAVAASVETPGIGANYDVIVQEGAIGDLGSICQRASLKGRAFLLSDPHVAPLYGSPVAASLEAAGFGVFQHSIPAGEQHKTLATLQTVYDWMLQERIERSDFLVCVGGGVVTDMGGFAAATVLRGVPFVHVPTTLLGMVDASIGGKTGVDHPLGKNMVGAFAQPRAVVIDPSVLHSLPERELRAGWAEVIKHGFILDEQLTTELEEVAGDPGAMRSARLIGWSAAIKAAVVSGDEREAGQRTLLNYGHTLGHAIESVSGYSAYLHGEAVAIGMRAAGNISVEMGLLSPADFDRQQRLIQACGLPESAPGLDVDAVLAAASGDKKVRGGAIRWVLLDRIGHAVIRDDIPPDLVRRAAERVLPPA